MSHNKLLITWQTIHEELFVDDIGRMIISLSTLRQKHGPKLKACGAVYPYHRGKARTRVIAGWFSVIQNYFIRLGQLEDAERVKAKTLKKQQKANIDHAHLD